jgi:hypothetical protein
MRLSMSSLAGTARTLVAVGTVRLDSMLATTRAAAPRSGCGRAGAFSSDRSAGAGALGRAGREDVSGCPAGACRSAPRSGLDCSAAAREDFSTAAVSAVSEVSEVAGATGVVPSGVGAALGGAAVALAAESAAGAGVGLAAAPLPPSGTTVTWSLAAGAAGAPLSGE